MKVLVFDTETTGLPTERNPSITDVHKWPYVLQLSYILYDTETRELLEMQNDLIKIPLDVEITPGSEAIHHISRQMCQANGIAIDDALNCFNKALDKADVIVGHNISFDKRLLMVESKRLKKFLRITEQGRRKAEFCTMKKGTDICQLEVASPAGEKYYKYPTLSELHFKLFAHLPSGTHNALADILICLRCYIKMTEDMDFVTEVAFSDHQLTNLYREYCTF